MNNKLLCPFCQQELKENEIGECWFLVCSNQKCKYFGCAGEYKLWEVLADTKNKLDIAIWGLEWIFGYENVPKYVLQHIRKVLDVINQKEE